MIKKIFFVFVLALMSQLIVGCVDCNCGPYKTILFTNKGLSLKNLDSNLPQGSVASAGIIPSVKYGIQVQHLTENVTLRKPQIRWGLIQSAYACSCQGDYLKSKEEIVSVKIISNNDFDANYPKGSDLSLIFKVKRYYNDELSSINDYLKTLKLEYQGNYPFQKGIFLQVAPTTVKKHKFKVVITLSDGRVLEAETTEVELT